MSDKEYIERGMAMEKARPLSLSAKYPTAYETVYATTVLDLAMIPAADVEPVVRGEWVPNKRHDGCMVCDQCGFGIETKTIVFMDCNRRSDEREFSICAGDFKLAYCPHCGAHMERSGSGE